MFRDFGFGVFFKNFEFFCSATGTRKDFTVPQMFEVLRKHGFAFDIKMYTAIIEYLVKTEKIDDALKVLDVMQQRCVVQLRETVWSNNLCAKCGRPVVLWCVGAL